MTVAVAVHRDGNCGQLPFLKFICGPNATLRAKVHVTRERIPIGAVAIAVETRLGAYMIRSLCIFLVLSCVVGLTGLMTGNLWNRYAEENALPRLGGIYQRIAATGAGLVELTKGYAAPATRSQAPATRSQFELGASPFEE